MTILSTHIDGDLNRDPADYRLTVKVRNNRLLRAIEAIGGTTGAKWCEANGLSYTLVNNLINMKISPLTAEGEFRPVSERLCEVLNKLPEDLWSNEQLYPLERNFSEMELSYAEVCAMLPESEQTYLFDSSEAEADRTKKLLSSALSKLTLQEQKVVKMRFYEDMTLDKIANTLDVTRERIRQVEGNALRKLRRKDISETLADCID